MLSLRVLAILSLVLALAGLAAAKPDTPDVVWILRCIGDSLGGNACHGGP